MECEFGSRERSGEEEAELQRSTKKVKEDQLLGSIQVGEKGGVGATASGTLSYKAKLVGDISGAYVQLLSFRWTKKRNLSPMKRWMIPLKELWPSSCQK